ncbi:MAG TPA: YceI family protein [Verrucomicrobiae bacterium]|nr:YceI family protein [Verrucomicrobiae bacterium]
MSRLFGVLVSCVAFVSVAAAQAGTWQIDPNHSSAEFAVRHLGLSTVRGVFTKLTGSAVYDPADPAKATLEAIIDATSVDTRVQMRDNDLRSPHFFDVEKYPTITFHSTQVKVSGPGRLQIEGDLTMHGVTKRVVLDVEGPTPAMKDQHGTLHIGASASTTINRHDFGVDGGAGVVGDDVAITIDTELIQRTK